MNSRQQGKARQQGKESLAAALRRYAMETGRQLLFDPALVRGKHRRIGSGGATNLQAILRGTGLRARVLASGLILIERNGATLSADGEGVQGGGTADDALYRGPGSDIIVTALKRPSRVDRTPGSFRVVQPKDVSVVAFSGLEDIARTLPGLTVSGTRSGEQRISIRGINGTGEATVGVYYGETPVTGPSGTTFDPGGVTADVDLIDLDRVEILHGPQGTLYGASSMGGTVRVLFRRPDNGRWSGQVSGGINISQGGTPGYAVSAVVNAPIVKDSLAVRLVVYNRTQSPYIDKPALGLSNVGRVERKGGRIGAEWTPTQKFRLSATLLVHNMETNDTLNWGYDYGPYNNLDMVRIPYSSRLKLGNIVAEADLGVGTLLATASRYRWTLLRQSNFTEVLAAQRQSPEGCARLFALAPGSGCDTGMMAEYGDFVDSRLPALLYQPMQVNSTSGEVRFSSADKGAFRWTVGAFFENRSDKTQSFTVRADPGTGMVILPLDVTGLRTIDVALRQRALFGEVSYHPLPGWTATMGMRRFHYEREASGTVPLPNVITGTDSIEKGLHATSENGNSLKFEIGYRPYSELFLYVQAAQGFRPGGVNITPGLSDGERAYQADRLWSYELGGKWREADKGSAQIALYHIDWDNMIYSTSSANGAFTYNRNVGSVNVDGLEVRADYRLTKQWSLLAQVSYTDARLAKGNFAVTGGEEGDRLPDISPFSWMAGLDWQAPIKQGVVAAGTLSVHGVSGSDSKFNSSQPYDERSPSHMIIDLAMQLREDRGNDSQWDVSLVIQNLLNARSMSRIVSSAFSSRTVYGSRPRTLAVRLTRQF